MIKKISFLDLILSIFLFIIIISSATFFVLKTNFVFYFDIAYFDIPKLSGLPIDEIKEIYIYTIKFVTSSVEDIFNPPYIVSSISGSDHFIDVRNIFSFMKILLITSIIIIAISIGTYVRKRKFFKFISYCGKLLIVFPLLLSIFFFISFEKLFVIFHEIIFTNDKWIFSKESDPIITMLPEGFFMHCGIMIIILSMLMGIAMIYVGRKLTKITTSNKPRNDISL